MSARDTPRSSLLEPVHEKLAREPRLSVGLARGPADIEDAQRLRYEVFAQEMGAQLGDTDDALDQDEFDPFCDHLIVRDDDTTRVVGTYRILPPHKARQLGKLYSENEFDLSRLTHLRSSLIEVGRSCVHVDYRTGSAILLLWAGLAQYMKACRRRVCAMSCSPTLPAPSTGCSRACRFRTTVSRAR
jgi:putative hemolysin